MTTAGWSQNDWTSLRSRKSDVGEKELNMQCVVRGGVYRRVETNRSEVRGQTGETGQTGEVS